MRSVISGLFDSAKLRERDELVDLAERIVENHGSAESWTLHPNDTWIYFRCAATPQLAQGWKLHLAASALSAVDVASAVVPILIHHRALFKMVRSKKLVARLNEAHSPQGASGKFITIYPSSDEEAVRIATECHEATRGLNGPAILSDRRFAPGSLVHYRYGGFVRRTIYNRDGRLTHVIQSPDGELIPDVRWAWFAPPSWVKNPFRSEADNAPRAEGPKSILIGGRYRIAASVDTSKPAINRHFKTGHFVSDVRD